MGWCSFFPYCKHRYSGKDQNFFFSRTLLAHLASHPYLVYNFFWGENHHFFTLPRHTFQNGISTGLSCLIDFWSCFKSLLPCRHIFVVRRISCTNDAPIASWCHNLCLKLTSDIFWPTGWLGAPQKPTGPHTDAIGFGGILESVSQICWVFENRCTTFHLSFISQVKWL